MITETNIKSPCNNICRLDEYKVCVGCKRTLDEIAKWSSYTEQEKLEIIKRLKNEQ